MTPAGPRLVASPPRDDTRPAGGQERVVAALRAGDEAAFNALVEDMHASMIRHAYLYTGTHAAAEDVVQETWLGLIDSLDRFEGRCSLKTWIFRILHHIAHKRARRERRSVPLSSFIDGDGGAEASVDPGRFLGPGERWAGHWATVPHFWDDVPEQRLESHETRAVVENAIAGLPAGQRAVIALRDIEGWDAKDVCGLLGLSEANQRVLLHRARSRVRGELERYLGDA
ncbi:MAG: RNA polymerase sigma factor [Actinomycetota bacterium]|nr:RNA polymerase sigma factor [Actinomycetota bacterium]